MKTLKTWEMLRDIREGETYEVVGEPGYFVKSGAGIRYGGCAIAQLSDNFMSKTWRKRTPVTVVDFAEAFAAYEKGARIKPEEWGTTGAWYEKTKEFHNVFDAKYIRGQWIVEGDGDYGWE